MPKFNEKRCSTVLGIRGGRLSNRAKNELESGRFDVLGYSETVADSVLDWVLVFLLLGCKSFGAKMVEARGVEPLFLKRMFCAFACVHFQVFIQSQIVLDVYLQGYLQGYLWPS